MMNHRVWLTLFPLLAHAATIDLMPLVGAADDIGSAVYQATAAHSGVARLNFSTGDICSGSAIAPTVILTAAHCIEGNAYAATAYFTDSGTQSANYAVGSFVVHPAWTGNLANDVDLALVVLTSPLASWVTLYPLYSGLDDVGLTYELAGWGAQSSGGQPYGSVAPPGTGLRVGNNRFDSVFVSLQPLLLRFDVLISDFDNPLDPTAVANEVTAAPGDSGGPAFLNGFVAAVTSFSGAEGHQPNGGYGEINGMTRVVSHAAWIRSATESASAPEPATFGTLVISLLLLSRAVRRGQATRAQNLRLD